MKKFSEEKVWESAMGTSGFLHSVINEIDECRHDPFLADLIHRVDRVAGIDDPTCPTRVPDRRVSNF